MVIKLITACRVRKQKERYAVTELRKQQNRMNFGEIGEDVYQEDLGVNRGNIGKGGVGGGSLRMAQVKVRRTSSNSFRYIIKLTTGTTTKIEQSGRQIEVREHILSRFINVIQAFLPT